MSDLTGDQLAVLRLVAERGNRERFGDPLMRKGVRAYEIARRMGWRKPRFPNSLALTETVPAKRAAVNRLLALRSRGYVTDVDGRWFTTDEGERFLRDEGKQRGTRVGMFDRLEACDVEPGTCPRCGGKPEQRRTYWMESTGEITCAHTFHEG